MRPTFFFLNETFLRTDTSEEFVGEIQVFARGLSSIEIQYRAYSYDDEACCPSITGTVEIEIFQGCEAVEDVLVQRCEAVVGEDEDWCQLWLPTQFVILIAGAFAACSAAGSCKAALCMVEGGRTRASRRRERPGRRVESAAQRDALHTKPHRAQELHLQP